MSRVSIAFCTLATLAACATYWFHPVVWWIARRVRIERELACDDSVIAAGTEPREYAGHLLEIAYSFGGRRAPALAVCMARPRQLEGRMLAVLDATTNRRLPSRHAMVTWAAAALVVLVPLSAITLTLQPRRPRKPIGCREGHGDGSDSGRASVAQEGVPSRARDLKRGEIRTSCRPETIVGSTRRRAHVADGGVNGWIDPEQSAGHVGNPSVRQKGYGPSAHRRSGIRPPEDVPVNSSKAYRFQLTGAGGPVQFKVRRDAGTFTFEGVIRNGVGAGTFSFIGRSGISGRDGEAWLCAPTPDQQSPDGATRHRLRVHRRTGEAGIRQAPDIRIVRAGQHGVQATTCATWERSVTSRYARQP